LIYCLDTDILIEYFRGNEPIKRKIENALKVQGSGLPAGRQAGFRVHGLQAGQNKKRYRARVLGGEVEMATKD